MAAAEKPRMAFEVECLSGLETFAAEEVRQLLPGAKVSPRAGAPGRLSVADAGNASGLARLRTAVAVHKVMTFPFARPSGFLGDAHMRRLLGELKAVMGGWPPGVLRTVSVSAAGRDTHVFRRLTAALAEGLEMAYTEGAGDLVLSLRRADRSNGWEVLARTTPRPLSARAWRVCNMPGALDATVANAVARMTVPSAGQRFLNIMSGSATMLIERLELGPAGRAAGVDINVTALDCAAENLKASGHSEEVEMVLGDAAVLPFDSGSFDAVAGDLPFGMLVRRSADNMRLYPQLFDEAARVAAPGGVMCVVTNDHRSARAALNGSELWRAGRVVELEIPWRNGYIRPAIYTARRRRGGMP